MKKIPKEIHPNTKPGSCACCKACRIYTTGPSKGRCVYGGPFTGYTYIHD